MSTPRPHELKLFFASKDLASDGEALPSREIAAVTDARTFAATDLAQADGYWNGASGWFAADTATSALRDRFFHVRESRSNGALILSKNLPAAPIAGDTFYMICGGGYRGV